MIDKVYSVEEGVQKMLTTRQHKIPDYVLTRAAGDALCDTLTWEGKTLPLFTSYYDCRLHEMALYGADAKANSALNVYSFVGKDMPLCRLIYREFVIAEQLLHAKIEKVMAFVNENAVNMIVSMDNGTLANIDLGNTMAAGSTNQCQHRLITKHGMTCDRAVGTMTVAHQLQVFGEDTKAPTVFDDDEYYLFGLDEEDVCRALTLYAVFTGMEDTSTWFEKDARYRAAIRAVYRSGAEMRPVKLSEVAR